jgi:O-antigen/teichoic acid export membrane protein
LHKFSFSDRGFIVVLDQGVVSITNLVSSVIIARGCSKEEFGLYTLGFVIILILVDLQGALIMSPYTIYSPRFDAKRQRQYAGNALIHHFMLSSFSIFMLSISGIISKKGTGPQGLSDIVFIISIFIPFILLKEYIRRYLLAHLRFKIVAYIDVLIFIAQISGLILLNSQELLSAKRAFLIIGLASACPSLIFLIFEREKFSPNLKYLLKDLTKNWSFGKWIFSTGIVYLLTRHIYPWLLAFFHGTIATGTFAAYLGISNAANPALIGIRNFLEPKASHTYASRGHEELVFILRKTTYLIALILIIFCVFLFVFGGKAVAIIFGAKYSGGGLVVSILGLSILFSASGIAMGVTVGLWALQRPYMNFYASLLTLTVTITFGLWLVKSFGPLGAALALLVGNSIASLARAIFFKNSLALVTNYDGK